MIQRIQTLYLFIVAILSFVSLFCTIGRYVVGIDTVASFGNFTFSADGAYKSVESSGPWALGILLIMVVFLSVMSIMLFRKRMRQLRLTIFSCILLIGYIATYAVFAWKYQLMLETVNTGSPVEYQLSFIALFPVLSLILNVLAICGIRKDEALVRSLDRLR